MQPTISVIVPVYRVEKYLDRCISSLAGQTHGELEIILVDDGSDDSCSRICDEWAIKDARIQVVHKRNGGLSDARNAGVGLVTGGYLSFIDSDDYISCDFFEMMSGTLAAENSDIIECDIVRFDEEGRFGDFCDSMEIKTYSKTEGLSGLIAESPFHQHVWNKLYKAETVRGIPFPFGKLNEDEFWTYQAFGRADRVTVLHKAMYYYFQRSTSIMGEGYNLRRLDALEGKRNRQAYIEEHCPELASQSRIDFFASCIFACQSALKYLKKNDKKKALTLIKQYVKCCRLSRTEIDSIQGKNRFWLKFADRNFFLCCKVRSALGVGF